MSPVRAMIARHRFTGAVRALRAAPLGPRAAAMAWEPRVAWLAMVAERMARI